MPLSVEQLAELRAPFFRVGVKAIIFDSQNRLVLVRRKNSEAELIGGGLEHDESIEDCVRREAQEEIGVDLCNVSGVLRVQTGQSARFNWPVCRLVVRADLVSEAFHPGDGMHEILTVTRQELADLLLGYRDTELLSFIYQQWQER